MHAIRNEEEKERKSEAEQLSKYLNEGTKETLSRQFELMLRYTLFKFKQNQCLIEFANNVATIHFGHSLV